MSFQYQAPVDRELFNWQFTATPPEDMGQPSVVPGDKAIFICREMEADPEADPRSTRQALLGRYGLVMPWAQVADTDDICACIAKVETAANGRAFRRVWDSGNHCIVPVQYFERSRRNHLWTEKVRISSRDDESLGVAGLWSLTESRMGVAIYSFALLTTSAESDPILRHFKYQDQQPRMPLFVPRSQYDAWLDTPPSKSMALISKFRTVALKATSTKAKSTSY